MKNKYMVEKNTRKKIVFIANILTHHQIFNRKLIYKTADSGWDVIVISARDTKLSLNRPHVRFIEWRVSRTGINPLKEFKSFISLCKILSREKPNIVHNFTIKANIYGTLASKLSCRANIINTVTGLGYVFTEMGIKSWLNRTLVKVCWICALNFSQTILFMNKDDKKVFLNYIFQGPKKRIIPGHGIDINSYNKDYADTKVVEKVAHEIGLKKNELLIVTVGRLIRQKGIIEFWEAAKVITDKLPNVKFVVVGMTDMENPTAITSDEIKKMTSRSFVFLFDRTEIKEILSIADIFVLASYREGGPQVIIEAMAMGLPIITTDVPGCRERVKKNCNGLLVRASDSHALEKAITKLILNRKLRKSMGAESLRLAKKYYDSDFLTGKVIKSYVQR